MKNNTLARILRPIAATKYQEQRNHIHNQFKKMLANGMSREQALQHAQFSVDSLTGNYAQVSGNAVYRIRKHDGITTISKPIQRTLRRLRERVGWLCFQAA